MTEHSQHNPLSWTQSNGSAILPPLPLSPMDVSAPDMLATLYLTSAAKALPVPQFHPGMYINSWLSLYETEATLVGVSSDLLGKFLPHYLLPDIGEWIHVSRTRHDWAALTELLTSTYGLDPEIEKLQWRRALQATKQGTLPIHMFRVKFAMLANNIPSICQLSNCTILAIFMENIKPQLRQLVEPTLTKYDDWESAYATAMEHEN
ncbi:hypothetical protein J3Q64DRAFT_1880383 [Phycomyces blakesleeanus]|uniref:Retrotransposon gag domain-containing protein n=1 Tax=Phycomyces blakesleeanus TaxID=4837 RepID=A0ABR3B699_PHYBL